MEMELLIYIAMLNSHVAWNIAQYSLFSGRDYRTELI